MRKVFRRAVTVSVITHERQLAAMREAWTALLQDSVADTLFLTWEWVSTWWSVYGDGSRLSILAAHAADGRLVGLAPLKRTARSFCGVPVGDLIEFIGYGGDVTPDHLDFIAKRGWEEVVVDAFTRHLQADATASGVDLRPFSGQSRTCELLRGAFASDPARVRHSRDSVAPILPLPATAEDFLAGQSRNYRKKMREYENRCERELAARVRLTQQPGELERDFAALVRLHRERWRRGSRAFRSRRYLTFHARFAALMLERGWLRLFSLEAGDTRLASLYCFAYRGRYYFYQAGRSPRFVRHRVGLVLMHRAILHAIGERATVFDFLRGSEEYKYHWATVEAHNLRFTRVNSVAGHLATGLQTMRPVDWRPARWGTRLTSLFGSLAGVA